MKCVRCGTDSKYSARSNRTCPACRGKFAFEPKAGDPVTDGLFQSAIAAVSGDGRIRWGVEHLYYEVCRRLRKRAFSLGFVLGTFGFGAFLVVLAILVGHFAPAVFGFMALVVAAFTSVSMRTPFVPLDLAAFNRLWDRWKEAHGNPAGLIVRAPAPPTPAELESDIGDYSFDRAVIVDRARTVDLLVANNFHFENNCAILSDDGYPKGPFQTIKAMLKKNPRLQVFVLHDCTPAGCALAQKVISDPEWFGGVGLRVIDLGLRPRHAGPFAGLLLQPPPRYVSPGNGLAADEAEWLAGHSLELAAVRPEQTLKRLFAGLTAHANDDPRTGDSSGGVMYCGAFDAGGYGGGVDGGTADAEAGSDAFG